MKMFLGFFIAILSIVSPSLALSDAIDIDYDFYTRELTIGSDIEFGESTFTLYLLEFTDCIEQKFVVYTEDINYYTGYPIVIQNVDLGKYEVAITGIVEESKKMSLILGAERTRMTWCPVEHETPIWYNIYVRDLYIQTYDFEAFISVGSDTFYDFYYLEPKEKYFMYVTAEADSGESSPSNEAIMFIAIPAILENLRIE